MKVTIYGILMLSTILLTVSCNNQSSTDNKEETHAPHDHQHDEMSGIAMNQGQKWMVNEEMKPYIQRAQNHLNQYFESNSTDFKILANNLKTENTGLIKSCTMDGQSHDELHKWLEPHMALIKDLENAENLEEANDVLSQLKASFETYNQYFQ
jgi:hypothetical protein